VFVFGPSSPIVSARPKKSIVGAFSWPIPFPGHELTHKYGLGASPGAMNAMVAWRLAWQMV